MAQYRFSAQVIKRSDGRSAVAAAAYRAGERLVDERLDMPFDYRSRDGVEHTEIMLPIGAPSGFADRATLWNAVEAVEKRTDAQVAREVQLSLPHELSFEQRRELVCDFVQTAFVDKGMVADIAMHRPDAHGDDRNFHAHVMLSTRRTYYEQGFRHKERDWNSRETLAEWRQSWAETQNRHLAQALGPKAPQVSHKSFEDREIDREATIHLGPTASAIERKGERSERGDMNREILAANDERRALRKDIKTLQDHATILAPQTYSPVEKLAKELDTYKGQLSEQLAGLKAQRAAIRIPANLKPADVRREIVGPAKAKLADAKQELGWTQVRVKRIVDKRTTLASFIRDPQRAIWARIRELHALDRARRDVARARTGVKVREDWFRSDDGRAYVLHKVDASRKAAQPAKQQVRSLDRKIRRVAKQVRGAEVARNQVLTAEQLGVKSWSRPIKTKYPDALMRHIDAGAKKVFERVSPQQLLQARQQAAKSLTRGLTMGFTR